MPLPHVTAQGNLTADPEIRFTKAGVAVTTLRIATNERKKNDAGEWVDGRSTYVSATLWHKAAEAAVETLKKGSSVLVTGLLVVEEYTDKAGNPRQTVTLDQATLAATVGRPGSSWTPQTAPAEEDPF